MVLCLLACLLARLLLFIRLFLCFLFGFLIGWSVGRSAGRRSVSRLFVLCVVWCCGVARERFLLIVVEVACELLEVGVGQNPDTYF